MQKSKKPISVKGELVATESPIKTDFNTVVGKMSATVHQTIGALFSQDLIAADTASRTANALYAQGVIGALPDERLTLDILRHMVDLYVPLVRVVVFQLEGRFTKACEELAKGLKISNSALSVIEKYARLPNADNQLIETYRPVLYIFPILFKGMDANLKADMIGYQGNLRDYRELLLAAVREYRQIGELPQNFNLNPIFMALATMVTTWADRLSNRYEFSASWEVPDYLRPSGNQIFIIHGHAEAKWRELQKLLMDEFGLDTIVLKEEPGAGETLIQKFEKSARNCCYAFALLTPDDSVAKKGATYFQARPNVLFELGWFYGHFGADRVCIIKRANTQMPSDLGGVLNIDFHDDISESLVKIRAELQRAGIIPSENRRLVKRSTGRAKQPHTG